MSQFNDFVSLSGGFGDLFGSDIESAAVRGARIPRERPARPERPGSGDGGTPTPGGTASSPSVYLSGDPSVPDSFEYNVQVTFRGANWTAPLKAAVIAAADAISQFIVGDLPDAVTNRGTIDDISLIVRLVNIDGAGGVIAQSGPTAYHEITNLPSAGTLTFDLADATSYQASGLFDDTVLHEMLHTLGFGTLWQTFGLIDGAGTSTPTFNGAFANDVYPGADSIPVEDTGGSAAYTHWDEAVFGNELMTSHIDSNNELSYMTVASLSDLGYSVVLGASYEPPAFI